MKFRSLLRYPYAAAGAAWMFSLGLFSKRHRAFARGMATHFGWKEPAPVPTVPAVESEPILRAAGPLEILELAGQNGNVSCLELALLCALARQRRPSEIFEIGTFDGRTTLNLARSAGPEARVWTLDLPAEQAASTAKPLVEGEEIFVLKPSSGARFRGEPEASRITQLLGDSAVFDFAPFAGRIDFVFVDGSHARPYVESDTRRAWEICRPGGTICWHDYGEWPDVTEVMNEFHGHDPRFADLRWVRGTTLLYLEKPPGAAAA